MSLKGPLGLLFCRRIAEWWMRGFPSSVDGQQISTDMQRRWRARGRGNSSQSWREFSGPRRHICHYYSPGACGAWELPLSPPKLHPSSILGPVPLLAWNWLFSGSNSRPLACFSDPVFWLSIHCSSIFSFLSFTSHIHVCNFKPQISEATLGL